jgi:undecaprenyl-diphosphatase
VTLWEGLLLGLVQGLTEFLPVSSSGHLVVTQAAVGLAAPGVVVEVVLHVATVLAVVIVYRRRLHMLLTGLVRRDPQALRYIGLLAVGSVPAALVGIGLADFLERAFDSLLIVGCGFIATGLILWSTRWTSTTPTARTPSVAGAGVIGFAQALAILPGISRSGTTVATGLWLRIGPDEAAEFSFLLAIPAIAGAALLKAPELSAATADVGAGPLLMSFCMALVSGVLAIRFLVVLLRRRAFHRFAPYCWGIGAITVWWALAL